MSPYQKIIQLLKNNNVEYELLEHEAVFTSEQAAAVRELKIEQGAKSLLFKTKGDFVLVVLPGNEKVDSKKLKKYLGVKNVRLATKEEVLTKMGVEVGACYPFGNIAGLRTLVDKSLGNNQIISCNPGRHDISIKFSYKEYIDVVKPEVVLVTT